MYLFSEPKNVNSPEGEGGILVIKIILDNFFIFRNNQK